MRPHVGIAAPVRHAIAGILCALTITLALAACGRIPESVARTETAKLNQPTAAPTALVAASGTTGFTVAETPAGNPQSGQTAYLTAGCQNCHGAGGKATDPSQKSLVGGDGLIVTKNLDTAEKFSDGFNASDQHNGIKDNPALISPTKLTNMYAYLIAQMGG